MKAMFEAWASRQAGTSKPGVSEATLAVLRPMWMAFAGWCIKQELDPLSLTASELDAYLRSREGAEMAELSLRYSWRLVTLIGRVLKDATSELQGDRAGAMQVGAWTAASDLMQSNPDLRWANDRTSDPLPEFLTESEDRALVAYLELMTPRSRTDKSIQAGKRWQEIRNCTAIALQRGAGLTPLEIRTLKVASVFVDPDVRKGPWKVRAPATGSVLEHDAPVAAWARPLLTYWLRLRLDVGLPGDWLFASTSSGKPWGKTAHFEAVASVMEAAGLVGYKGGSYLLRHTFAIKQLSRPGASDAKVAAWLGIAEEEMGRYRRVLTSPVDVR
jgi:site-specific recombinase XerD